MNNYNDILRNTRENLKLSIADVSTELRVRKDIIQALENGDFSKIPPQGFSKNMIRSYARLLGLDAYKITEMFLKSENDYNWNENKITKRNVLTENRRRIHTISKNYTQSYTPRQRLESISKNNNKSNGNDYNKVTQNKTNSFYNRETINLPHIYKNNLNTRQNNSTGSLKNNKSRSFDIIKDFDEQDNYLNAKERLKRRQQKNQSESTNNVNAYEQRRDAKKRNKLKEKTDKYDQHESLYNIDKQQENTNKINFSSMHIYNHNNKNGFKFPSNLSFPIFIVFISVLILIVILVVFVTSGQYTNSKTDVSNVNVTGLTDPEKTSTESNNSNSNNTTQKQEEPKPTKAVFAYKVNEGQTPYVEIYEGTNKTPTVARKLRAGETQSFDVTTTLKFVTSSPKLLTITVDGATVEPVLSSNGVYTYTVDFNQILNTWQQSQNKTR